MRAKAGQCNLAEQALDGHTTRANKAPRTHACTSLSIAAGILLAMAKAGFYGRTQTPCPATGVPGVVC